MTTDFTNDTDFGTGRDWEIREIRVIRGQKLRLFDFRSNTFIVLVEQPAWRRKGLLGKPLPCSQNKADQG